MSGHKKYDIGKVNKRPQASLIQLGFFGGAVSPTTGAGQSPGGGWGAKPPEARDFTLQMT